MTQSIIDPLLQIKSKLIIEGSIDEALMQKMLKDISDMSDGTRDLILSTMLKMHKEIESDCGDLELSLNTKKEISDNSEPEFVFLTSDSTRDLRIVKYHYSCDWETFHDVEVVIANGNQVLFIGNCGYYHSIDLFKTGNDDEYNYL